MRKLITSLMTSVLLSAGAVTGTAGIAQPGTVHTVTQVAAGHAVHRVPQPRPCIACRI